MDRSGWWLAASLAAALVLAIMATTTPFATAPSADPGEAHSVRAFAHVERIAAEPHPTGSAANARVRAYLVEQLQRQGMEVSTTSGAIEGAALDKLDHWRGAQDSAAEGFATVQFPPVQFTNVIGVLPGSDRTLPAVALMAHYDSVWGSPGAPDDAAGVAAILDTVRAIAADGEARRDIVVILTDAEELGLVGARAFFTENPLAARIGAIVNLEARGGGGIASMFQTAPGNAAAMRLYAREVSSPSTSSLSAFIYSVLPNDTDLSAALDRGGYIAYNIAFIGRSGLYHSPLATPANLDRGSLHQMTSHTHALTEALANAEALPAAEGDAVFFDLFGLTTMVYPPWTHWLMLALALAAFGACWLRQRAAGGIVSGALRMSATLIGIGMALYLLNWLSGAGTGAGYYDRLAAIPKLTGMALAATLGMIAMLWSGRAQADVRIGASIPLVLLALLAQIFAPTAAYFIVIPVTLVVLAELTRAYMKGWPALAASGLSVTLVTGYMLTLGYQMMQGVGPSIPYVVALPAALALMSWLLLWPGVPRSRVVTGVLLISAIGLALWVRFDPVPPSVAVYSPLKPA